MNIKYNIIKNFPVNIEIEFIIDFVKFSIEILLDDIEMLHVFIENLEIFIEHYNNLDQRFGRTLWSTKYNYYNFDISTKNFEINIHNKCYITLENLEDIKNMYNCLKEIYSIIDKEDIPDRYKLLFS